MALEWVVLGYAAGAEAIMLLFLTLLGLDGLRRGLVSVVRRALKPMLSVVPLADSDRSFNSSRSTSRLRFFLFPINPPPPSRLPSPQTLLRSTPKPAQKAARASDHSDSTPPPAAATCRNCGPSSPIRSPPTTSSASAAALLRSALIQPISTPSGSERSATPSAPSAFHPTRLMPLSFHPTRLAPLLTHPTRLTSQTESESALPLNPNPNREKG